MYLSVPMVANRDLKRARLMARVIEECGNSVTSPWVLGPLEPEKAAGANAFERDKRGAETSDAIVADVSQPSIGVGMELMAAYQAGRKVILVAKAGAVASRMLLHMDRKVLVEFDSDESLAAGLRRALSSFGNS